MNIAVCLNVHENNEVIEDTLNSIKKYVSNNIVLNIDGAFWRNWENDNSLKVFKLQGFHHNYHKNPYRNVALGLMNTYFQFPKADWYLYTEYDTVYASDAFKIDLENASTRKVWCIGNDVRLGRTDLNLTWLKILGIDPNGFIASLLGCCVFYHKDYIKKLIDIDFFNNLLYKTNVFTKGFFPGLNEAGIWDLSEIIYPTMAVQLGGRLEGFASWEPKLKIWQGCHRKYKMRWCPDIEIEELPIDVSIVHPLKKMCPVREYLKNKR